MRRKVWQKELYKRKIWTKTSNRHKILYYLKPFAKSLITIWIQPLPYPTALKLVSTAVVILVFLIPVIYPCLLLLWTYVEIQYFTERSMNMKYPGSLNLMQYLNNTLRFQVTDNTELTFLTLYLERWRIFAVTVTSSIDYLRLAFYILCD